MNSPATPLRINVVYHVSPNGRDDWPGTPEQPFASPAAALAASRAGAGVPRSLRLHGGAYYDVSLALGPQDSLLTIEAAAGETPILYGGRRVIGWQREGGHLFAVPLAGVREGTWDFRMLSVNGRFAPRARIGPFTHRSTFDVPWMSTTGGGWKRKPTEEELTILIYQPGDLGPELDIRNAELTVYHQWDESVVGLKSLDAATQTLRFSNPSGHPPGAFGGWTAKAKTYVVWNVREGLTEPGQWCLDRTAGKLVYWPLPGEDMEAVDVIAPTTGTVIRIAGEKENPATRIILRGLTVAVTTTPLIAGGFGAGLFGGAVSAVHAADCEFVGLTVMNAGGQGIKVEQGKRVRIEGCETRATGAGGISCFKTDDSVIEACHVHHNGRSYPSAIGVWVTGANNRIAWNEIHHTTYSGIDASGSGSRFEQNLIYDVMQTLNDGAAIYVTFCKDFVIRGNVVRGASGTLAHAYYLDEQAENCVVEDNLAVNTRWPSHNHMARRCIIRRNVFVDSGPAKLTFMKCQGFTIEENVIVAGEEIVISAPADGIAAMPRNVFFSGVGKIEREILADYSGAGRAPLELAEGSVCADPLFMDVGAGDYRYRPGSPAGKLGLEPIPIRLAGRPVSPPAGKLEFHVSPSGNDAWSGTLPDMNPARTDGPFATLEAARDAIRRLKGMGPLPTGGVTVWIHGGAYVRTAPFELTVNDSGTTDAPIVYRAWQNEPARLLGGRRLEPAAFTPVTDARVLARLAPAARDRIVQCDLRAQGVTDFGTFASRGFGRKTVPAHLELFINDRPMTVAQWPDAGQFAVITGYTKPLSNEWGSEAGDLTGGFTYEGDRPQQWAPSDNIWVHGYWAYDWANSYERVRRLDPAARVVETDAPHGLYYFHKKQRFYFLNVLEELDQPGEYYVDRDAGLLYVWPPAPLDGADILVSVLAGPLVSLRDASHVVVRDLILEAGRGDGLCVTGGEGVLVAGCTIRNCGNWAVKIEGGLRHTVTGCELTGVGDGGVSVNGGDRATLTPCGHAVLNNHIHHFARWSRCYVAGVGASGVGMRFANNLIHDAPHNAILFWGNDFLIENNEIHRVCLETGDAGAIYIGRDFTFRGNVIRRNFIHHMGGVGMGSIAIYMDDCVSGTQIVENIMWACQYGLLLGGGRDFVVENNIFVECRPAIHADARGVDPNPVWQNMVNTTMKKSLDAMRHHEPPYSTRHPEIAAVDRYYAAGKGVPPENNRVARNIAWRCETWISETWPKGASNGIEEQDNLVGEDPRIVNLETREWGLRPDSPALKLGFKPIPIETIGLVVDEYRSPARVPGGLTTAP
jgi:hypothetical protein